MWNPILFFLTSVLSFFFPPPEFVHPLFCVHKDPLSLLLLSPLPPPPLSIAPPTTVSQRRKEGGGGGGGEVKDFFEWWRGEERIFPLLDLEGGRRGEICSLFQTWLTVVHPIVAKEWREKSSFFLGNLTPFQAATGIEKLEVILGDLKKSGENFECYFRVIPKSIFPQKYVTLLCSLIK